MMKRILSLAAAIGMTLAIAGPALAAQPVGPNPYPAVSAAVCQSYGGTFSGGGNDKTCVVVTNTSETWPVGKSGKGFTLVSIATTTFNVTQGARDTQVVGTVVCTNPGGQEMKNPWIKPCQGPLGPQS
jgi:hypothetical protein